MKRLLQRLLESDLFIILIIAPLAVLWLVVFPFVFIDDRIRLHRKRKNTSRFICVSCGEPLGPEALILGEKRWKSVMAELYANTPDAVLSIVRDLDAICPHCGYEYMYHHSKHVLLPRPNPELVSR